MLLWRSWETKIVGYSLEQPKFVAEKKPKCELVFITRSFFLESCTAGKLLFRKGKAWAILPHPLPAKDISAGDLESILHLHTGMKWNYSTCSKTLGSAGHYLAKNEWARDTALSPCPINIPTLVPTAFRVPTCGGREGH